MRAQGEVRHTDPVLCYTKDEWAYFTTRSLDHQWGDDWDDIPYETNAGVPYEYSKDDRDIEPWGVTRIAFRAPGSMLPSLGYWSVQMINEGKVPWLIIDRFDEKERRWDPVRIMAGTTLSVFRRVIQENGGEIYAKES